MNNQEAVEGLECYPPPMTKWLAKVRLRMRDNWKKKRGGEIWNILYIANYDTKLSVPSAPPKASCWGIPLSCLCTGYQGTIDRHGINPWRGEL